MFGNGAAFGGISPFTPNRNVFNAAGGVAPARPAMPKYNPGARDVALRALANPTPAIAPAAAAPAPAALSPGASAPAAGSYAKEWDSMNSVPGKRMGR